MTEPPLLLRSRGDADVCITVPRGQPDRLTVLMTLTAVGGRPVQVELTRADVGRVLAGLADVLAADSDRLCAWWYRLASDDRPGTMATAEIAPVVRDASA